MEKQNFRLGGGGLLGKGVGVFKKGLGFLTNYEHSNYTH